ncbi:family 5 glycoside hydrolase [Melampsora larici-populina 98AG31]|uniref:Family 5 glycoside hydrolase n=1 Tax=Melampsora larici-populina (strain 98AG31 / pathotype 3-4-7) TaxID=747676 RepID=F4RJU1_MELLP|nr:family 5 glycoside hydrolase [Melampsora larici-populina 98AG31]EGG07438.1 family 5 glycoside hydrolase [Melampsora larici-populina 98AG31]
MSIPHKGTFSSLLTSLINLLSFQIFLTSAQIVPLQLNDLSNVLPKPAVPQRGVSSVTPQKRGGFVSTKNGHFYLGENLFDFRGFNGPTLLDVANKVFGLSKGPEVAHITGWDNSTQDWIYNEETWRQMDNALAIAAEHGVKIIMPIINQDYGSSDTDWVGNFIDLIRYRFNITEYTTAQVSVDWFVNSSIREDFKKIIKKLLTRVNTVNGRLYGRDDTFLAFETGNEMNWAEVFVTSNSTNGTTNGNSTGAVNATDANATINGTVTFNHTRPAPAEWTIDIAKYIKQYAPHTLVMDGSYSRNPQDTWPEETLKSPYVDIFSYHLYNNEASFEKAYKTFTCAGALAWSLRPHAESNGFITHSESDSVFSYHVPGWTNSTASNFDPREAGIVALTYKSSFEILNKPVAPYPVPASPLPYFGTNGTHIGITWKGAAWAQSYQVWASESDGGGFIMVANEIHDNVESGDLFVPIDVKSPKSPLQIPYKPQIHYPEPMPIWRDTKWSNQPSRNPNEVQKLTKRHTISIPRKHSKLTKRQNHPQSVHSRTKGGWFIVRGISVDGLPGPFSEPTFIPSTYS